MSDPTIKTAREVLARNQDVKSLTARLRATDDLQQILRALLPSMLADYCRVRRYEQGVLHLDAESGSAATQLRFIQTQLVQRLRQHSPFQALVQISVRVNTQPRPTSPPSSRPRTPPISAANRRLLEDTADGIQDTALAGALRNLAQTLKGL